MNTRPGRSRRPRWPWLAALREPATWRPHQVAFLVTGSMGLAQVLRVTPLIDPLGGPLPDAWGLAYPAGYLLLAPLFTLWDAIALLPMSRITGFLAGLGLAFLVWRVRVRLRARVRVWRAATEEAMAVAVALAALVGFLLPGIAWRERPMVRLAGLAAEELALEPHSHTSASHDVDRWPVTGFDLPASLAWHARAGVDVLFVTDHNSTAAWAAWSPVADSVAPGGIVACPGVEISAASAHLVVLGESLPADPAGYRGDPARRAALLAEVAANPRALALASLPEYRGRAREFADEGVRGFELISGSPTAAELTRAERETVVALARQRNLLLVAAGDQHGYGATPAAWNVLQLAGWRRAGPALCGEIVQALRAGGPETLRLVERRRLRPDSPLPWILTPLGVVALAWGAMPVLAAVSWLAWVWALSLARVGIRTALRRRRARAILSAVGTHYHPPPGHR